MWEFVSGLLKEPERPRAGLERLIEQERGDARDPEQEARAWLEKLSEVDHAVGTSGSPPSDVQLMRN